MLSHPSGKLAILALILLMGGSCSEEVRSAKQKEFVKEYKSSDFAPYDLENIVKQNADKPYFLPESDIEQCLVRENASEWKNSLYFPLDGDEERSCYKLEANGYTILSMAFLSDEGLLPYLVIMRAGKPEAGNSDTRPRTAIFLVGGPQNSFLDYPDGTYFSFFKSLLAGGFDRIIVPAYYGTGYRDAFPRSDTEAGGSELSRFIEALTRKGEVDRSELSLVAFSGGSLIANDLREKFHQIPAVLIAPPLDLIAKLPLGKNFPSSSASTTDQPYSAFLVSGNGRHFGALADTKFRRTSKEQWFPLYFGPYFAEKSLRPILEQRTPCRIAVIGTRDQVISAKRYAFQGLHAKFIEGMEHIPKGNEFIQIATAVDQAIKCQNEMAAATG